MKASLRLLFCLSAALAIPCVAHAQSASAIIPSGSEMARADSGLQRLLVSGLEASSKVTKGSFRMDNLLVEPAAAERGVKCGQVALAFQGDAAAAGAKGDFQVAAKIPGQVEALGIWVDLEPESNVASVGLQVVDAEGEYLRLDGPPVWDGWLWMEFDLKATAAQQAFVQNGKNGVIDFPIRQVNVFWFAREKGPSRVVVDGLVALTRAEPPPVGVMGELLGGDVMVDAGQPAHASYLLTNFTARPIEVKLDFLLQRDPLLQAPPAPDPVLGSDQARGAKSWTEFDGKVVEEGSLTDGSDQTGYRLPWKQGHYAESWQYIDLGKEREIVSLRSDGGDANWMFEVDVAASSDGTKFTDVPELQGVDFHKKWGSEIPFPSFKPFKARYLRFRHHHNGQAVDSIAFPKGVAVFDGIADETWTVPSVGEVVMKETRTQLVPPRSFFVVNFASPQPLSPGAYHLAVGVTAGPICFLTQSGVYALALPTGTPDENSRFGINGSNPSLAPLLKKLGVGWMRYENMKWAMVSDAADHFDYVGGIGPWNLDLDTIFETYTANGMRIAPMMFMTPLYISSAPANVPKDRGYAYPPKDNTIAADFWFQTAARYGSRQVPAEELKTADKKSGLDRIKYYEIWNEQNLHDPGWGFWVGTMDQYYEMLRPASEAVKRADPNAVVSIGAFAGAEVKLAEALRTYKYSDGKTPLDFVDLLNFHFYSGRVAPEVATMDPNVYRTGEVQGGRTFEQEMEALAVWRDQYKPGAPIWLTETGYDTAGPYGLTERLQAARLPRLVMIALGHGVDKVFVYREAGSNPGQHAASGLVRGDGSIKPSFITYATLIRELDGVTKGQRLPYPDENVRVYRWTKGNETLLSAWAVQGTGVLDLDLGRCMVTDAFGHRSEVLAARKLPLSEFPVYFSNISNLAALESQLAAGAKAAQEKASAEAARISGMKAWLFDFGTDETAEKITIGTERPFAAVAKNSLSGDREFGFQKPAMEDVSETWKKNPLNKTSTKVAPATTFLFPVEPGRYRIRLAAHPLGDSASVEVTSGGAAQTKPLSRTDKVVEFDFEAEGNEISVRFDGYASVAWMTVIDAGYKDPAPAMAE